MFAAPTEATATTSYLSQAPARERAPFLPALVVVAVFIPEAFGMLIGDFRITLARAILLVSAPVVFWRSVGLVCSGRYRFVISDVLIPLTWFWWIIALANTEGLGVALKSGGVAGLEFVVGYSATRYLLEDASQAHAIVRLFCIVAGIGGSLGLLDTFSGSWVLREGLAKLTGYTFYQRVETDLSGYYRFGLFRAMGPLEHPILFGIAMCYALILSHDVEGRARTFCRIGCSIGLFVSLSSGPWQATIMAVGLSTYRRLVRFRRRWLILIVSSATVFVIYYSVMTHPFGWLFSHLQLDPSTGYFRMMIWDYAGDVALQSPIFGIGTTSDWERPGWMPASVDSLWLRSAMTFGIPGALLMGLALIGTSSRPVETVIGGQITARDAKLAETLGIISAVTVLLGFMESYWGVLMIIVAFLAGTRAFLGQLAQEQAPDPHGVAAPAPRGGLNFL
jgi:hypothetical protein